MFLGERDLLLGCIARIEELQKSVLSPGHLLRQPLVLPDRTPRTRPVRRPESLLPRRRRFSSFNRASGAVSCMAASHDFDSPDFALLVGACCSQLPEYNRPGELQRYCRTGPWSGQATLLHGHSVTRPVAHADPLQRRTVSALCHSGVLGCFLSAGYDGAIALWPGSAVPPHADADADGPCHAAPLSAVQVSSRPVLDIACPPPGLPWSDRVFYGTAAGQLGLVRVEGAREGLSADGFVLSDPAILTQMPSLPVGLASLLASSTSLSAASTPINWVEHVSVSPDDGQRLFFGVGWHSSYRSGVLQCWSLAEARFEGNLTAPEAGLSAVDVGSDLIAVGTGNVLLERVGGGLEGASRGTGTVELYPTRMPPGGPPVMAIRTGRHFDIDCIRWSPDSRFLVVGDAHDHAWSLWDLHAPARPLLEGSCRSGGGGPCDEVMDAVFAASPTSLQLLVGGQDGNLHYYDIAAGTLVDRIQAASSINCILPLAGAPDGPVAVGCETGTVDLIGVRWPDRDP